jgi:tetrahydromethanopterin S-methyltransferase subunit F
MRFVQLFMFKVGIDQIANIVVGFLFSTVFLVTLAL